MKQFVIIIIIVIIILQLSKPATTSFPQINCIYCGDFNRQPNGCATAYYQCGNCLPGFIQDAEDNRLCYALEILASLDEQITGEVNSQVDLICKFNGPVSCRWSKDGDEVKNIGTKSNRKWSTGNGENTEDCSMIISHLSDEDVGSWVCSNMADSNVNQISSTPTQIYIKPTMVKRPEEKYEVEEGNSITLPCVFDHPVSCLWTKDGNPVPNNGNHHYAAAAIGTDCSLTIATVSEMHNGEWTCTAKGDSNGNEVTTILKTTENNKATIEPETPTMAAKTRVNPLIYYGYDVVNGVTLMYPGDAAMEVLFSLQCELPSNMTNSSRIWWVLHEDREYQEQSNGPLYVGDELGIAMGQLLKLQDKIELICMAVNEKKEVSTANVFFVNGVSKPKVKVATAFSSYFTIFTGMSVFIVLVMFGAIGALVLFLTQLNELFPN